MYLRWNIRKVICTPILVVDGWGILCEITPIEEKSTVAQVMAWCRLATSHYFYDGSLSLYGVTMELIWNEGFGNFDNIITPVCFILSKQFILYRSKFPFEHINHLTLLLLLVNGRCQFGTEAFHKNAKGDENQQSGSEITFHGSLWWPSCGVINRFKQITEAMFLSWPIIW